MSIIDRLLRANIRNLEAYASARSEYEGPAAVFLDANENALAAPQTYARYPDPLQRQLKTIISGQKGLSAKHIFLGNGSDEAIDLLIRCCCVPGQDHIILCPPTYGMYAVAAQVNDVAVREVSLDADFRLRPEAILAAADAQSKLLFLCSPNNPTGNLAERAAVRFLLERFRGLVVLDEAYIDFAGVGHSWLPELDRYDNLVVLQTASKAWGLAGLRLGMAFAAPGLVAVLNRVKPPYNIGSPAQEAAREAFARQEQVQAWVTALQRLREKLAARLAAYSFVERVYPSQANFLLLRVADADRLYTYLLRQGIVVRHRGHQPGCANCLRITVGSAAENARLLEAFDSFMQQQDL